MEKFAKPFLEFLRNLSSFILLTTAAIALYKHELYENYPSTVCFSVWILVITACLGLALNFYNFFSELKVDKEKCIYISILVSLVPSAFIIYLIFSVFGHK